MEIKVSRREKGLRGLSEGCTEVLTRSDVFTNDKQINLIYNNLLQEMVKPSSNAPLRSFSCLEKINKQKPSVWM